MALYEKSAQILSKLKDQAGTIKSLILSNDSVKDKKSTYALVCQTLKYKEALSEIMEAAGIMKREKKISPFLVQVLTYEILFGHKRLRGQGGKYTKMIMSYKTRLDSELARLKIRRKVHKNEDLIPDRIRNAVNLPRYVRINALKTNPEKVISDFIKAGYKKISPDEVPNYKGKFVAQDIHIKEILILPSSIDLHDNPLLLNGHIIIQDKASCFPAFVLSPPANSVCIDACAAPGNKTSHLSAILNNTGKIFAFDMDQRRLNTLIKLTGRAGCKNIVPTSGNFLQVDPKNSKYKDVEYILLDPSCSGSGIVGRLDHLVSEETAEEQETKEEESQRLQSLAEFQKTAILHAMKFPKVKKIVYSTCSKHIQENEDVVKFVLEKNTSFELEDKVFPSWNRRGLETFPQSDRVIRTLPEEDFTIGFFVALFKRKNSS